LQLFLRKSTSQHELHEHHNQQQVYPRIHQSMRWHLQLQRKDAMLNL
jgi:hypothetical protein